MDRSKQTRAANTAVHAAINELAEQGHNQQDVANALMAYALQSMVQTHGRKDVARHLYMLAVKFNDDDQNPLDGAPLQH